MASNALVGLKTVTVTLNSTKRLQETGHAIDDRCAMVAIQVHTTLHTSLAMCQMWSCTSPRKIERYTTEFALLTQIEIDGDRSLPET